MRERQRLDVAVSAVKAIEQERDDTVELMEMAEAEGDSGLIDDGVKALATLPSLDEIRAKIVGVLQAPATKVAGVLQAPAAQLARVLAAYAAKDEA